MKRDAAFYCARRFSLGAVMFCYLFYYTGRQTFGFAIPGIQEELGLDKQTLGWVSAALLWCYACGQMINGNLGDKFGGRRMMALGAGLSFLFNWLTRFKSKSLDHCPIFFYTSPIVPSCYQLQLIC